MGTYTGGASSLTVKWSGLTVAPAKIAIKLCYTKDQIVDRAWRKFKDNIKDNKQCKQTADTAKFLVEPFASTALEGEKEVVIPMNTAPTTLQGTMGFFCAFSLIFAASVWAYDVKKQNAI